jgi:NUMOD4 motif/HNH endonuclease
MEYYKNKSLNNINGEIWVSIKETNGEYLVSNYSRIKSLKRKISVHKNGKLYSRLVKEKIIGQVINSDGYCVVSLSINGIKYKKYVHRIIATEFIENPEKKDQVNHKDGVKNNNNLDNLEWVNNSENLIHSYRKLNRKISKAQLGKWGKLHHASKKVYCPTLDISFESTHHASRELGIGQGNISNICLNKNIQTEGLVFRYI